MKHRNLPQHALLAKLTGFDVRKFPILEDCWLCGRVRGTKRNAPAGVKTLLSTHKCPECRGFAMQPHGLWSYLS